MRDKNIDFIKILACVAVVGLHTLNSSGIYSICYFGCSFAVPFFFMANGYFILNKGEMKIKYIANKVKAILKITIIWVILYFFIMLLLNKTMINPFETMVASYFQKGVFWHFWFLGALIIIYAILPILYVLFRTNKLGYVLLAFVVCSLSIDIISLVKANPVQQYVPQMFRIGTWCIYFILGGYLNKYKEKIVAFSKKIRLQYIVCILIPLAIGYQYLISMNVYHSLKAEYFYDNLFIMLLNIALFVLLLTTNVVNHKGVNRMIDEISICVMGVYVIHPFLIKIVIKGMNKIHIYSNVLLFLCVLVGSVLVVKVIERIPIMNHFIILK